MVSLEERLIRKLRKGTIDDCWVFTGAIGKSGYGHIGVGKKIEGTHRVAFELWCGAIPHGLCVLHKCDVRACCNPNHLFLGTKGDNAKDMSRKGRQVFQQYPELAPIGELNGSAKLNSATVFKIKTLLTKGRSKRSLAKEFCVSRSLIQFIANGTVWSHL